MKSRFCTNLAILALILVPAANARDVVLPAGTILKCTLNEPNFSTATAEVGDPVLCSLREVTEFGEPVFPRGSYLVGHLESAKDPGHFFGRGNLKLRFDRIGLPSADLPLDAKVIATRGYKVDKEGKIAGHGHAKRDVVEWMLPPLWPWKVVMLPARGPRPKLKGETTLSLRLMDDVQIPQVAAISEPERRFPGRPERESFHDSGHGASLGTLAGVKVPSGGALFILKNGTVFVLGDYTFREDCILYTLADGGDGVISSKEVDWTTTLSINARRGLRIIVRTGPTTSSLPTTSDY